MNPFKDKTSTCVCWAAILFNVAYVGWQLWIR